MLHCVRPFTVRARLLGIRLVGHTDNQIRTTSSLLIRSVDHFSYYWIGFTGD